jgi:uncharacterized protein (DUF3820 family)
MAISFNKLKDPKLQLTDKITFGKLKDCRICDVIQDHYEYLIWAEKQGFVQYSKEVTTVILETANFAVWEAPQEERPIIDTYDKFFTIMEEDIPF